MRWPSLCAWRVEVFVLGVALLTRSVGSAGIEVAHAFAVRQEIEALSDPHRARDVAFEFLQTPELARALGIDPQMAGGAAAVAFPARRVGGVAADDLRVARPEREVVHLPQRQHLRRAAFGRDRVGAHVAEERLAVRADEQDLPLRRPAAHQRVGAEPGQPPGRAALGRHHADLGVLLVAADERKPLAVGRQARCGRLGEAGRQPPGDSATCAHVPEVVVADEGNGVGLKGRETQVRGCAHESARGSRGWRVLKYAVL